MANIFSSMIQELRNGGRTDEQIKQMFDADIAGQPTVSTSGNIPASSTAFAQGADNVPVNLTYEEAEQLRQYAQNTPEGKQLSDKIYQQLQSSPAYQARQQGTVSPATPTPGQTDGTYEQNRFSDRASEPLDLNQPVEQSQPTQKVNPPAEQSTEQPQQQPSVNKNDLVRLKRELDVKKNKYLEMVKAWKESNYTAYTKEQLSDAYIEYKNAADQYNLAYRASKGKQSVGDKGAQQLAQAPKNTKEAVSKAQSEAPKPVSTTEQPQEPKVATIQEQATKNPGDWIYIGKGNAHADKNGWYQLKQGDIDWAKSKIQKA